jgi:hypothetical protein
MKKPDGVTPPENRLARAISKSVRNPCHLKNNIPNNNLRSKHETPRGQPVLRA